MGGGGGEAAAPRPRSLRALVGRCCCSDGKASPAGQIRGRASRHGAPPPPAPPSPPRLSFNIRKLEPQPRRWSRAVTDSRKLSATPGKHVGVRRYPPRCASSPQESAEGRGAATPPLRATRSRCSPRGPGLLRRAGPSSRPRARATRADGACPAPDETDHQHPPRRRDGSLSRNRRQAEHRAGPRAGDPATGEHRPPTRSPGRRSTEPPRRRTPIRAASPPSRPIPAPAAPGGPYLGGGSLGAAAAAAVAGAASPALPLPGPGPRRPFSSVENSGL